MDFVVTVLTYTGLLLVFSAPVVIVAARQRRSATVKRFLLIALGLGLFCGLMVAGSNELIAQCEAEGNSRCFDAGASGLVVLILGGFLLTSIVKAYLFATD